MYNWAIYFRRYFYGSCNCAQTSFPLEDFDDNELECDTEFVPWHKIHFTDLKQTLRLTHKGIFLRMSTVVLS